MYTVGIVGLGHIARHQVAALSLSQAFTLLAGCDTDERAFGLLERNVERFTDLDQMLALRDLDIVVVASPNRLHVDHGIAAMEAGKRILMEKPAAETSNEFARFLAARKKLDGKCTFALHAAHGLEVAWFLEQFDKSASRELVEFDARFYDPYFESGRLLESAASLGGSWTDSGINALSVICQFVDPANLVIRDSRLTRVADSQCREVQGTVDLVIDGRSDRRGIIDTNWTLGRNHKSTRLRFANDESSYILNHSTQQVLCGEDLATAELLFDCDNGHPRLTNHYVGVFEELARHLSTDGDNFSHGEALHQLLYEASAWPDADASHAS